MSIFTILIAIPLLILLPLTNADIRNIKISSDSRPDIFFEEFGFTKSGHLSISVESATFTSVPDPSRLGFCMYNSTNLKRHKLKEELGWLPSPGGCLLDDNQEIRTLFNFTQLVPPQNSYKQSYEITVPDDDYQLQFVNCQPNSSVTMKVRTEMYNLDNTGNKNYLSVTQIRLPVLYSVFAAVYFLFALYWTYTWDISLKKISSKDADITHLLMVGLVWMKILSLISAAIDKQNVNVTGTPVWGWNIVLFTSQFVRVTLMCVIIFRIGTGWSILKSRAVQIRVTTILIVLLLLQVASRIALSITRPTTLVIICSATHIGIFFSVICSISWITSDGKNLVKKNIESGTVVTVFLYQYSMMILILFVDETPYTPIFLTEEIITLLTYTGLFYTFHLSVKKNVFIAVDDDAQQVDAEQTFTRANDLNP